MKSLLAVAAAACVAYAQSEAEVHQHFPIGTSGEFALYRRSALETAQRDQKLVASGVYKRSEGSLPATFNLRDGGFVTSVKYQTMFGCADYDALTAYADTLESTILKQTGQVQPPDSADIVSVNPYTIAACHFYPLGGLDCGYGSPLSTLVSAVEHFGLQDHNNVCISPWSDFLPYEFDGVVISDSLEARHWLVQNGAFLVKLQVPFDFDSFLTAQNHFTYDQPVDYDVFVPAAVRAFAVTGYDWTYKSNNTNLTGAWIIKGVGGTQWADNGYARIAAGQLGFLSGLTAETVGFKIRQTDDQIRCIRGARVTNWLFEMAAESLGFTPTVDTCDALRLGNIFAGLLPPYAIPFHDAAISVPGYGVEPFIDCSTRYDYNSTPFGTRQVSLDAYASLSKYAEGDGLIGPMLATGCTVKDVARFKIKLNSQCADEVTPSSGNIGREVSLIGFSVANAASDAAFCNSDLSTFRLDALGVLRTQSRYVSTYTVEGQTYLTIQIGSPVKFSWDRVNGQLKLVDPKDPNADMCVKIFLSYLVVAPCSSAGSAPSFQML